MNVAKQIDKTAFPEISWYDQVFQSITKSNLE